jgi:hypothetical protein
MDVINKINNSVVDIREHVGKLDATLTSMIDLLDDFAKQHARIPIKLDNFIGLDENEKEEIISSSPDPTMIMLLTEQVLVRKNTESF